MTTQGFGLELSIPIWLLNNIEQIMQINIINKLKNNILLEYKNKPIIPLLCYILGITKGALLYFNINNSIDIFNKYLYAFHLSNGSYFGDDKCYTTSTDILDCFETILVWFIIGRSFQFLYEIRKK